MSSVLANLVESRDDAGRMWEHAFSEDDLEGMDAAMAEIRKFSRLIAEATA
jgi:hypothetical protein